MNLSILLCTLERNFVLLYIKMMILWFMFYVWMYCQKKNFKELHACLQAVREAIRIFDYCCWGENQADLCRFQSVRSGTVITYTRIFHPKGNSSCLWRFICAIHTRFTRVISIGSMPKLNLIYLLVQLKATHNIKCTTEISSDHPDEDCRRIM